MIFYVFRTWEALERTTRQGSQAADGGFAISRPVVSTAYTAVMVLSIVSVVDVVVMAMPIVSIADVVAMVLCWGSQQCWHVGLYHVDSNELR